MSEEEIIERFKILIANFEDSNEYYLYDIFQKILDLYNKEKEKNKNLLFTLNKSGLDTIALVNDINNNYISKDKIKERIEQIKMNANYDWIYKYDYQDVVKILKDLLEEQ